MKEKILAALLAALMLLGTLPAAGSAEPETGPAEAEALPAETELQEPEAPALDGVSYIDSVQVDIRRPEAGGTYTPGSLVSVPAGSACEVEYACFLLSTDPWDESTDGMTMEAGKTYELLVVLKADDAYDYADSCSVGVSGASDWRVGDIYNAPEGVAYSALELYAYVTPEGGGAPAFTGMISRVTIDVTPPLGGASASGAPGVTVPEGQGYVLETARWQDAAGSELPGDAVFRAGETYFLHVLLIADPDCWWNQIGPSDGELYERYGSMVTTVNGGELMNGYLSTTNSTLGSWAEGVIAVKAAEAPAGLVQFIRLGFSIPEAGASFDGRQPVPAVQAPEGGGFRVLEAYWVDPADGEEPLSIPFDFEAGETYAAAVVLEPEEGFFFDEENTNSVSVENAIPDWFRLEDGRAYLTFQFDVEEPVQPGPPVTMFAVWISDTEGTLNRGGGYTVSFTVEDPDLYGQMEEDPWEGMDGSVVFRAANNIFVPESTQVTLTAKPDAGYVFRGWYPGDEENVGQTGRYYGEERISDQAVYVFTPAPGSSLCAVFEKAAPGSPGDVNGDGLVNRVDRICMARALAGVSGYALPGADAGDLNGDGAVTAADRAILARTLARTLAR